MPRSSLGCGSVLGCWGARGWGRNCCGFQGQRPVPRPRATGKATQTTRSSVSRAGDLQWIHNCSLCHLVTFISVKGNMYKGSTVHLLSPLRFLDRSAKGGTFPLLCSFFTPLFFCLQMLVRLDFNGFAHGKTCAKKLTQCNGGGEPTTTKKTKQNKKTNKKKGRAYWKKKN